MEKQSIHDLITQHATEIFDEVVAHRKHLHAHPELSFQEYETAKYVSEVLTKLNIQHETGVAGTGVVAIIRGDHHAPNASCIGLRADLDALPIQEENEVEYKSIHDGIMHACGHDAHATIVLGVGKIIKELADSEESINGNVKLFFQPAEETIGGGERMVQEGCMENPKVDYVLGLHVMPYLDAGRVELKYGKLNASTDSINITLKGKASHGAYPDKGIDAISMAGNVITALQTIVSRNTSPLNSVVISLGKISGGVKDNVIADEVKISGTLRTLDDETRSFTKDRINSIVNGVAMAFGGEGTTSFYDGYQALINDDEVVDVIKDSAEKLLGKENVVFKEFPSLGAEDFSYFIDAAKGAFFHLGCGDSKRGITSPIHTEFFDIDEECLKVGVKLQIENVLALLNK